MSLERISFAKNFLYWRVTAIKDKFISGLWTRISTHSLIKPWQHETELSTHYNQRQGHCLRSLYPDQFSTRGNLSWKISIFLATCIPLGHLSFHIAYMYHTQNHDTEKGCPLGNGYEGRIALLLAKSSWSHKECSSGIFWVPYSTLILHEQTVCW